MPNWHGQSCRSSKKIKLQILYKMIRTRPAELMIHIFDIFASNANNDTNAVNNGTNHQANMNLYLTRQQLIDNVICLHCIKEGEFKSLIYTYEQAAAKDPHMVFTYRTYLPTYLPTLLTRIIFFILFFMDFLTTKVYVQLYTPPTPTYTHTYIYDYTYILKMM